MMRHVISPRLWWGLPAHLALTLCGRRVRFGAMPNVTRNDPRFCAKCLTINADFVAIPA